MSSANEKLYNPSLQVNSRSKTDSKKHRSLNFDEIVEHLLTGKPISGIREIPDMCLTEAASSLSKAKPRPKPWE